MPLLEQDEWLLRDLLQPHLTAARQRMGTRHDQHELLVEDAHPFEAWPAGRHRDEHEIERAMLELLLDRRAVVLHEIEAYARVGQIEPLDEVGDEFGAQRAQEA